MLIVAGWGDCFSWREVEYRWPWERTGVSSKTSLDLLASSLVDYRESVGVLVVVQESLLAGSHYRMGCNNSLIEVNRGYRGMHEVSPTSGAAMSYDSLLDDLRGAISDWIRDNTSFLRDFRIRIGVGPAVGGYSYRDRDGMLRRARWVLKNGDPFDFYAGVSMLYVLEEMYDLAGGDMLRVVLDVTHGVNYTGTALYRSVIAAARLYSAANFVPVILEVYNSEPYVGVGDLKVWRIREEKITPRPASSRLVYMMAYPGGKYPIDVMKVFRGEEELLENLGRRDQKILEMRKSYPERSSVLSATSVFYGLPLQILQAGYIAHNIERSGRHLVRHVSNILRLIPRVSIRLLSERSIIIEHLLSIDYKYLKSYLAGIALSNYAEHVYQGFLEDRKIVEEHGRVIARVDTLGELDRYVQGGASILLKSETSQLVRALDNSGNKGSEGGGESSCKSKVDLYDRLRRSSIDCKDYEPEAESSREDVQKVSRNDKSNGGKSVDVRVYVAHVGLNSDLVGVYCRRKDGEGKGIYIGYRKDFLDRDIYKLSVNLLGMIHDTMKS